jgi:signal transduction histidine kinase
VGMGLSVARKIADLYGGRILLESQPGTRAPASRCVCPSGRPGTPWYT